MPDRVTFCSLEDFEAIDEARAFLYAAGFSCGSMQAHAPMGILFGDHLIAKWRNLSCEEKRELHGTITADSFRRGPVTINIFDIAPQEARDAFAAAKAKTTNTTV